MINVKTKDEIGELSEAFNLMIAEIRQYHKKISNYTEEPEDEVKIRAAKLHAANKQRQYDIDNNKAVRTESGCHSK